MVISEKHKLVLIQVPQTASSFLGNFFLTRLEGESILKKHSTYCEFLDEATAEQKTYQSIIGKRNPLDKAVTRFARRMNRRSIDCESMGELQDAFQRWFRQEYVERRRHAWNPHIALSYPYVDFIISQENLVSELRAVLNSLGLESITIPPWRKKTKNKLLDYSLYYPDSLIAPALCAFEDEMKILDYEVPEWCSRSGSLQK